MNTELIHNGYDNINEYILLADGIALADASAITRMVLLLTGDAATDTVDSDINVAAFDWAGTTTYNGASAALLKLKLGGLSLAAGRREGTLVVYSADYPGGLVWAAGVDFKVI